MVVVVVVVAAAAAAVVVVVFGGKLAFGGASVLGSARVLGVSPKGSVGAACVHWACLKIGREKGQLPLQWRQRSWAIGK